MSRKKNPFSIQSKLARAKKNKNEREIAYYTPIVEAIKRKKKREELLKKKKVTTEELAKVQYINPYRLANSRRKKLVVNITPSEKYIKEILDILKVDYRFQHIIFVTKSQFYLLDFYFPKLNMCIELDGKHHQFDSKQILHDKDRDAHMLLKGIRTIRLTNSQAMNLSLENIKTLLQITNIII